MSNLILSQEEATRVAKRLKKNLSSEHELDIPLNQAQHLLAKALGAANWNALDFENVTAADADAAVQQATTEFLLNVFPFTWENDEAIETGHMSLCDVSNALLDLSSEEIRSLRDNSEASEFLVQQKDIDRLLGEEMGFTVQHIDESFRTFAGKSNQDLSDFEVLCLKAALRANLDNMWVNAKYLSMWDGGTPIWSNCIVNIATGVVGEIETLDAPEVEHLDYEMVVIDQDEYEVVDQDEWYDGEPVIKNLHILFMHTFLNPRNLCDTTLTETVEFVASLIEKRYVREEACELLDDLTYDITGGKSASEVNNGGLTSQIEFYVMHMGLGAAISAIADVLEMKREDFTEVIH